MEKRSVNTLEFEICDVRVSDKKHARMNRTTVSENSSSLEQVSDVDPTTSENKKNPVGNNLKSNKLASITEQLKTETDALDKVQKEPRAMWEFWAWGVILCCGIYVATGVVMQISKSTKSSSQTLEVSESQSNIDQWQMQMINKAPELKPTGSVSSTDVESSSASIVKAQNLENSVKEESSRVVTAGMSLSTGTGLIPPPRIPR